MAGYGHGISDGSKLQATWEIWNPSPFADPSILGCVHPRCVFGDHGIGTSKRQYTLCGQQDPTGFRCFSWEYLLPAGDGLPWNQGTLWRVGAHCDSCWCAHKVKIWLFSIDIEETLLELFSLILATRFLRCGSASQVDTSSVSRINK